LVVIHEPVLEISCGQKECAQTDRHTPMTTRPCGLRRAGNDNDGFNRILTMGVGITTDTRKYFT